MRIAKVLAKRKLTDANFQAMHGPTVSESTFLGKRFLLLLFTGLFRKKRRHSHHNSLDNDSPLPTPVSLFGAKGARSKNVFCSLTQTLFNSLFYLAYNFSFFTKNFWKLFGFGFAFSILFSQFRIVFFPLLVLGETSAVSSLSLGRRDLRSVLWFWKKRLTHTHTSRRRKNGKKKVNTLLSLRLVEMDDFEGA